MITSTVTTIIIIIIIIITTSKLDYNTIANLLEVVYSLLYLIEV